MPRRGLPERPERPERPEGPEGQSGERGEKGLRGLRPKRLEGEAMVMAVTLAVSDAGRDRMPGGREPRVVEALPPKGRCANTLCRLITNDRVHGLP